MRAGDILDALYSRAFTVQDQQEAREWMKAQLGEDLYIFEEKEDIRKWALNNTDLIKPKEEAP